MRGRRMAPPYQSWTALPGQNDHRLGNFIPLEIKLGACCVGPCCPPRRRYKWSRFGRNLYAVGGNSQSALMLGINVKRTKLYSYLLCGLLSGIAGLCTS